MKRLILFLILSASAFAQNYRVDDIVFNRNGAPVPSATIAVCSQVAITAISEVVGTVTVTTTLNPPQGSTVTIVGITPTAYNGSYVVLTTSPTSFTYTNPTQGLGAGSTFGSAVVTSTTPCAPLANLCASYTDAVCASPNPVTGDGVGNYHFYVAPGHYTRQFYGSGLTARVQTDQVLPCDPANCSSSGTITAPNFVSTVATGTAPFTVTSTTQVPNLNVSQLEGKTWEIPGTIGSTTPNTGAFTTVTGSSVSSTGSAAVGTTLTITESAAPSGVASKSVVWADSTAHRLQHKDNNGSAFTLANTSGDTLTSTTLASPTVTGTASGNGTIPTAMLAATPSIIPFWCTGTATANTTLVLAGAACTATTGYLIPMNAGTVKNLFCKSVNAGVNASSGLVTVRKNVVNQALTCTIGTGTSCNDQTHTFSMSAGDAIDIIFTTQIGETLSALSCTVEKI